jgi:hypothetical protein
VHVTHAAHRLIPVPSQRWHRTTLSPFLSVPLPSQFLHFCFFLPSLFRIGSSGSDGRAWRKGARSEKHEAAPSDAVYLSPSERATRGHEFLIVSAPRNRLRSVSICSLGVPTRLSGAGSGCAKTTGTARPLY